MKGPKKVLLASAVVSMLIAGVAQAAFAPKFALKVSDTKVGANPTLDIHLEFSAEDEEIGNFQMLLPKGFNIAADDDIANGQALPGPLAAKANQEVIGAGTVKIEAGVACRPGPEGAIPASAPVTIDATIYEVARSDDEIDAGVHAVWLLDIEPANRVRLLVKGSPTTGWLIEGAPSPSDQTCNPLTVDLKINGKSESGVPLITNPTKAGKKVITANIISQDSPAVATFKIPVVITK